MTVIPNQQPSLMLVDGMALLFRAYYATASSGYIRRTKAGVPTNAIYGFLRYMWDAIDKFQPTHVACCWDMGSKHFEQSSSRRIKAIVRKPRMIWFRSFRWCAM